jgi:hypothetical protein
MGSLFDYTIPSFNANLARLTSEFSHRAKKTIVIKYREGFVVRDRWEGFGPGPEILDSTGVTWTI